MNALLDHAWGKSAAQDRVWAQVTGLAPSRAVRRWLMALTYQAFIDDSYTHGGEFVLAGHVATAENWAKFAAEWENLLPSGTLGKIGYHFKMALARGSRSRAGRRSWRATRFLYTARRVGHDGGFLRHVGVNDGLMSGLLV